MSYYQVVSIVVLHGESEKNIQFEIWRRLTPSTPPPKFLRKSPFSGHFITLVEELPSLFFADGNMTLHYKPPRQYPESSQTIPRPFQTPSRHLQDTPQTSKIWALFVHTIPVGVKQAANKNESNGMYINCLHIIPSNHNPESLRQPPDTYQTPSRHPINILRHMGEKKSADQNFCIWICHPGNLPVQAPSDTLQAS